MYDVKKYSTSKRAINSALYSSLVPVLNEQPTVTALSNHMLSHTHTSLKFRGTYTVLQTDSKCQTQQSVSDSR